MNWLYQNQPIDTPPELAVGFCYRITYLGSHPDAEGKKYYVGYKLFVHKTSRNKPAAQQLTKKGVPRKRPLKRRGTRDSKWRDYYGSCLPLKQLVALEGESLFKREILCFGNTHKYLKYYEAKTLFCGNVLESELYWNRNILGRFYTRDALND